MKSLKPTLLFVLLQPLLSLCTTVNLTATPLLLLPPNQFENLSLRPNGLILATTSGPTSALYQIDPSLYQSQPPDLVASFPGARGSFGITTLEAEPDVFYVAVGNVTFDGTTLSEADAFAVWKVDFNCSPVRTEKFRDIPDGVLINGFTSVPGFLLGADSIRGVVWSISLPEGKISVAVNDTSMQRPAGSSGLGINGIKYFGGKIYYTNSGTSSFYSHPIEPLTAHAPPGSEAKLIASIPVPDDFTLARGGSKAFVGAQGLGNVVYVDMASGEVEEILTDLVFAPTSVDVSRDGKSIYVTSSGALNGGVQGVAKIDVGGL